MTEYHHIGPLYDGNPFPEKVVLVEERGRYQETGWMICPTNSTPHINCVEAHAVKLFIKGPPPHEHSFALVCTGCGVGETE